MAVNPKLAEYKHKRYFKTFNKYLNGIASDLERAGVADFEAEVLTVGSQSLPGRIGTAILGLGYGKPQEALFVTTEVHECPVEITVPVGIGKISLPYSISVILPGSLPWRVVYERSLTGFRWQSEPKNKDLVKQLKKAVPRAVKKQKQHQKAREQLLTLCYAFQRTGTGNTVWFIRSGYEGGLLTGGYRPQVSRYIEAIPSVKKVLARY